MAMPQEEGQRPGHRSGVLGLASGPATHQPSDLKHHHPIFFCLFILTCTVETIIPPSRPSSDYRESPMTSCRRISPTERHETKVKLQNPSLHPDSPRPGEARALGRAVPSRGEAGVRSSLQLLIACALETLTVSSFTLGAVDYLGICVPAHADSLLLPRAVLLCFPLNVMTH